MHDSNSDLPIRQADPVDRVLTELERVTGHRPTRNGTGWDARCPGPNHTNGDRHPSLSAAHSATGAALLHCHAGCNLKDICASLGLTLRDLFAVTHGDGRKRRTWTSVNDAIAALQHTPELHTTEVTQYRYTDAFVVLRFDNATDKTFRPLHRTADGWRIGDPPGKLPLYRIADVPPDGTVYVVEGEKDADAGWNLGFPTVTSAHGAKSAARTDWTPLAGRACVIVADTDEAGRGYADTVAGILHGRGCRVRVIYRLPDVPDGGSVTDFIAAHDSTETDGLRRMIEAIAAETPHWTPRRAAEPKDKGSDEAAVPEWVPFPVELLPEPVRSYVCEGAEAIGCDPVMVALPALAGIAAAIGTVRRIRLKRSWAEPCVLWCVVVAESGQTKSPGHDHALEPLQQWQSAKYREHDEAMASYRVARLKYEAGLAIWKRKPAGNEPPEEPEVPTCARLLVNDATVEALAPLLLENPRGLLLERDEVSGWVLGFDQYKGGKGSDLANWLVMHRAGSVTVDRKTGVRLIHVPRASVSVAGTVTPGVLRRAMTQQYRDAGLLARLLLAYPPARQKHWTEAEPSESTCKRFAQTLDWLLDLKHGKGANGEAVPVDISFSPDGKRAWVPWYNLHGTRQGETTGDLAAAFSKLEGYAARFALVIQLVRWAAGNANGGAIDAESVAAGTKLAEWFVYETERVYSLWSESDEDRDRRELLAVIRRVGGAVTARDLLRHSRRFQSADDAETALSRLVKAGWGVWESVGTSPAGGRPTRRFRLVDTVDVDTTPENPAKTEVPSTSTPSTDSGDVPGDTFPGAPYGGDARPCGDPGDVDIPDG